MEGEEKKKGEREEPESLARLEPELCRSEDLSDHLPASAYNCHMAIKRAIRPHIDLSDCNMTSSHMLIINRNSDRTTFCTIFGDPQCGYICGHSKGCAHEVGIPVRNISCPHRRLQNAVWSKLSIIGISLKYTKKLQERYKLVLSKERKKFDINEIESELSSFSWRMNDSYI